MPQRPHVNDRDYARLLAMRTRLREFEHWSAQKAAEHGLTAAQHQLMLAVRGHPSPPAPTVGEIAGYLMIAPNAAVGLVDRTESLGLLERTRDPDDHRVVRLSLTELGAERLEDLTEAHLQELEIIGPLIDALNTDLGRR